jgi:hypothetical protein
LRRSQASAEKWNAALAWSPTFGDPTCSSRTKRKYRVTIRTVVTSQRGQVELKPVLSIKARYGTPAKAWAFWQRHHWY